MAVRDGPAQHPGPWLTLQDTPDQAALRKELAGLGKIVFTSNRDGNWEIYVTDPDGSGQTNLTRNPAWDCSPRWTRDGKHIVFFSDRDSNAKCEGVYDQLLQAASDSIWGPIRPGWRAREHDPEAIAMRDCGVYIMDANGANVRRLVGEARRPAMSPSDKLLTFERRGRTYTRNLETGEEWEAVMRYWGGSWCPEWSPDGTRLLVAAGGDIKGQTQALEPPPRTMMATVFNLKANGVPAGYKSGQPVPYWNVALGSMNLTPRWRPDGKGIVLVRGSRDLELRSVDFAETPDKDTGFLNGRVIGLAQPADRYIHCFPAYGPDARFVAFSLSPVHYLIREKVAPLGYVPWADGHQIVWQELCVGRAEPGKQNTWIQLTAGGFANREADWHIP